LGNITNHLGIDRLLTGLLGELIPDVEPVTRMLVNALTTDFELNGLNKVVTNPVEPTELGIRAISHIKSYLRENSLEIDAVDKITIALDSAGNLLAEVGGTIEGILNGFHGKVGITTVYNLPEGDLGVTSKVDILSTIGYEGHKGTTSHFLLYLLFRK
jgi:hypothetical protein